MGSSHSADPEADANSNSNATEDDESGCAGNRGGGEASNHRNPHRATPSSGGSIHNDRDRDRAWGPPPSIPASNSDANANANANASANAHSNNTNSYANYNPIATSNSQLETFLRDLRLLPISEGEASSSQPYSERNGKNDADQNGANGTGANDMEVDTDIDDDDDDDDDFCPDRGPNFEWTGRSLESLVSGFGSVAPILGTGTETKTRNTLRNGNGIGSGSGSGSGTQSARGTATATANRNGTGGRMESPRGGPGGGGSGPNVALHLLAREMTGRTRNPRNLPASERLYRMGGMALYDALDGPADGMCTEVADLEAAIDAGDWNATQQIVSKLAPRLIGDPSGGLFPPPQGSGPGGSGLSSASRTDDPGLPPTAPLYHAGGGRIGLEREAFCAAGGIDVLLRVFWEPRFVGRAMAESLDARDLSPELLEAQTPAQAQAQTPTHFSLLGHCWNEALACLRELVYAIPSLLETEKVLGGGGNNDGGGEHRLLPFLFTLLAHDFVFDGAAALIEEILSLQSHSPQHDEEAQQQSQSQSQSQLQSQQSSGGGCPSIGGGSSHDDDDDETSRAQHRHHSSGGEAPQHQHQHQQQPRVRVAPPTTFFLGNVPDLYQLWGGFNCRQLAQFCRILALLIFEPEDRQLLESPAVLKSIELLQLRRNRAARAARDSTVDMNQSILLGDEALVLRLLDLLTVLNFGPALRSSASVHVMAQFPYIADTLTMLGLHEFDHWEDVERYHALARKRLVDNDGGSGRSNSNSNHNGNSNSNRNGTANHNENDTNRRRGLHELGSVARMLETLSSALRTAPGEPVNQLGHIIAVIGAAQRAGVVVGRTARQQYRSGTSTSSSGAAQHTGRNSERANEPAPSGFMDGIWSDSLRNGHDGYNEVPMSSSSSSSSSSSRNTRILTPEDAANILQFNALLLSPFQVEILFVLCTLLGGRRKVDAQDLLKRHGIIDILDDMFQRLPWDSLSPTREPLPHRERDRSHESAANDASGIGEEPYGIHGPGCECTPESALCVQYLRLLHNFCDRDCDNYHGRRLLLSDAERDFVFAPFDRSSVGGDNGNGNKDAFASTLAPGLLSKIVAAFVGESDESPYRFWLSSCVESFLRGSSSVEQVFVARTTGLMKHLIDDVTSQRLHCAGSLQTSFDLLGELCKGNVEVLEILVGHLDTEERFRRLMDVASTNLVDSNVFIRSLILSTERLASERHRTRHHSPRVAPDERNAFRHRGRTRGFLTHTWLDTRLRDAGGGADAGASYRNHRNRDDEISTDRERESDRTRPSDWFLAAEKGPILPPPDLAASHANSNSGGGGGSSSRQPFGGSGWFGWAFCPGDRDPASDPDSIDRLSWFLSCNRTRLLRDLLRVVSLQNINHENICCLNTAVVIAIFAHRRGELQSLLGDLRSMSESGGQPARLFDRTAGGPSDGLDGNRRRGGNESANDNDDDNDDDDGIGSRRNRSKPDILENFREVLWFWIEYYTHRGRDRLSLEFSSRLRFHEWMEVVTLLAADDGAPTSLVRRPLRLPRSPYRRLA